ncbi:hypothetical protein D047_2501B, partial [Vibrio parahaemolyticus VPTS-2010_2]
FDD